MRDNKPSIGVDAFEAAIKTMPERDHEFARSLVSQWRRRGLSRKQAEWAEFLMERAAGAETPRHTEEIGDLSGILALFEKAREKLQRPAIVLSWPNGRQLRNMRLSIAGERARVPGSINVTDHESRDWYGRILADGKFEASPRIETPDGLVEALRAFAAKPAKTAAEHGRITGCCCFCHTPLRDERSTEVGYGPVCAKNWGLPWGRTATSRQALVTA